MKFLALCLLFIELFSLLDYKDCVSAGQKHISLDDWLEYHGIDLKETELQAESISAFVTLKVMGTTQENAFYLFHLNTNLKAMSLSSVNSAFQAFLKRTNAVLPSNPSRYDLFCYLRLTKFYVFFRSKEPTRRASIAAIACRSLRDRVVIYGGIFKKLEIALAAGFVFLAFEVDDFFMVGGALDDLILCVLHAIIPVSDVERVVYSGLFSEYIDNLKQHTPKMMKEAKGKDSNIMIIKEFYADVVTQAIAQIEKEARLSLQAAARDKVENFDLALKLETLSGSLKSWQEGSIHFDNIKKSIGEVKTTIGQRTAQTNPGRKYTPKKVSEAEKKPLKGLKHDSLKRSKENLQNDV